VSFTVRRRSRGGLLSSGDSPSTPARIYNLTGREGTAPVLVDAASGVSLAATGGITSLAGPNGVKENAQYVTAGNHFTATDTGLPSGVAARSYGVWFQTVGNGASMALMAWASNGVLAYLFSDGRVNAASGADNAASTTTYNDGMWHHLAVTEDNAAVESPKRRVYVDGRVVATSTVLNSATLGGAAAFRVGANSGGTAPFQGALSRAFVYSGALTAEQVAAIYNKGSFAMPSASKNAGDHVEGIDTANLYLVCDTLDPQDQIDIRSVA
jgi:hypothetical protein